MIAAWNGPLTSAKVDKLTKEIGLVWVLLLIIVGTPFGQDGFETINETLLIFNVFKHILINILVSIVNGINNVTN